MARPLLLILVLLVPLLAAGCGQGPDRDGDRGPYVSGGFGGH